MSAIESPCIKYCTLAREAGLCVGCGRSLAEIEMWTRLSSDRRKQIMAELPARLAFLPRRRSTTATAR